MTLDLHRLRQEKGGTVYAGGRQWVGPGPGHSRHDASLSVKLTDDGRVLVHSFARDPFASCADYLGLLKERTARPDRRELERMRREREAAARERRNAVWAFCEEAWAGTVAAEDTTAEAYLTGREIGWPYPDDLRFHPAAPLDYACRTTAGAMVCMVRSADGRPKGLHVTALKPDGSGKAKHLQNPRRMFGAVAGCAVQLAPPYMGELAVAEGVETAFSFGRLKGLPCWAALSTTGLQAFEVPAGVTLLHIAADGDPAGREAAAALARRASKRCDAQVIDPGDGLDWNDLLTGCTHA